MLRGFTDSKTAEYVQGGNYLLGGLPSLYLRCRKIYLMITKYVLVDKARCMNVSGEGRLVFDGIILVILTRGLLLLLLLSVVVVVVIHAVLCIRWHDVYIAEGVHP